MQLCDATETSSTALASRIDSILQHHGAHEVVAFLDRGEHVIERLSGTQLRERVLQCAARLRAQVPAGGPALLVLPASSDFVVSLLGCIYAGIIAIPLPVPRLGASHERLDTVVADSGATAVICRTQHVGAIAPGLDRASAHGRRISLVMIDDATTYGDTSSSLAGWERDPSETVLVQYTSGSTREPCGVALSSRNVLHNAAYSARRWRRGPEDVVVSWLPHFHDMGLFGGILFPLLWGARSIQMSPLAFVQKPLRWLRAISEFQATFTGGPAFSFGLCLESVRRAAPEGLDLSRWQVACCGGEPIPHRLMQDFRHALAPAGLDPATIVPCYGLAEATLLVAAERDGGVADCRGQALPIEPCRLSPESAALLQIVDPGSRRPVKPGDPGEIWVRGTSVAQGRFQREGAPLPTTTTLEGDATPYLPTGDLGRIDHAGLHVTGRSKDILIAQGRNIASVDIEWLAAEQHPALNPLAAAAFPRDPVSDEGAALVMEISDPRQSLDGVSVGRAIRAKVAATYGVDLTLIRFVKRGTLERTTSGKIRRQAVASRVRNGDDYDDAGVEA